MTRGSQPASQAAASARPDATVERRELALFAVATAAAWAHTIDEVRIGELIAVPFGLLNAAALAAFARWDAGRRGLASVAFGLFWGLAAIPYHLAPLLSGAVTGQNLSGLSRVAAGAAMVAVGASALRRRSGTQRA